MVDSMKAVKMLGNKKDVGDRVQGLRAKEIVTSLPFRNLQMVNVVLSYSTMTLSPLPVFGLYIGVTVHDGSLDISRMFTSLDDKDILVSIENAQYEWSSPSVRVVEVVSKLEIRREAYQLQGSTYLATPAVAYCDWMSWLENLSAERTIGTFLDDDNAWKDNVIHTCTLEDVRQLPSYKEGTFGNGGVS
ncbi:hypothetical protein BBP40_008774 [Aspergillus hancockii]|nr:hypothetical protein BBP40_008774 [Aspergillus hancockii]